MPNARNGMEEDPYMKLVQGNLQKLDKQKVRTEKVGRDLHTHNGNGLQSAIAAELERRELEAAPPTAVTLR